MNSVTGMTRLVRNENMKTFFRIKTLIFCIFLIVCVGIAGYFSNKYFSNKSDWKEKAKTEMSGLQKNIKANQEEMDKEKNTKIKETYKTIINSDKEKVNIIEYSLKHNIPYKVMTPWKFVEKFLALSGIVELFILVQASKIVTLEYNNGTMKQILIRPHKRWKILLSKFISIILGSLALLAFLFVILFIAGLILYGKNGMGGVMITTEAGKIVEHSIISLCLTKTFMTFVDLIILSTLAFMISTILKTNTLGLTVSLASLFGGSIVTGFISRYSWSKFVLFTNMDLTQYLPGNKPIVAGNTLGFSITMLAIYFAVFLTISFVVFNKRDVA